MNKKPTHGGRRAGAGRKALGRKPYMIRMKPDKFAKLKATAKPLPVGEYLEGLNYPTVTTKVYNKPWIDDLYSK